MIRFLVPARGSFSVDDYLARDQPAVAARFQVLHYEALSHLAEFPRGIWVLSGLDQLSPGQLGLVEELHRKLSSIDGIRFLNHPVSTLRRFDLLDALYRLGRNDFRAMRIGGDLGGLRYPVFLREERPHRGAVSPLLGSPAEVESAIGRALMRGLSPAGLLVVEFCSTVCPDGLYRKYSAFIVGGRVMGRSLDHGTRWMLKFGGTEYLTEPLIREEQAYVMDNPHRELLEDIFAIAGVQYGRIDYSMKNGRVQTWEINLNATIGRGTGPTGGIGPREWWPIRDETREYFFDRFREAWAEVDIAGGTTTPVSVPLGGDLRAAARVTPAANDDARPIEWAQSLARPFKRVLDPLSRPLLRLLGRAARLRQQPPT